MEELWAGIYAPRAPFNQQSCTPPRKTKRTVAFPPRRGNFESFPTPMKALLLFVFLSCFSLPVLAKGTGAKEALRTLARLRGASWLERVTQMNGDRGQDQPAAWHIIASNGKGGLQEFFVNAKGIISEGPVPADAAAKLKSPVVAPKKFVTDSTLAFVAAEKVAKRNKIGFDSANFRLRCAPNSTQPNWYLELIDGNGFKLSEVTVSASSGKVTNAIIFPQPVAQNQPPSQTRQAVDQARQAVNTGVKSVGRGFQKAGSWISRQFTPKSAPQP
jgi:hypothetical protein